MQVRVLTGNQVMEKKDALLNIRSHIAFKSITVIISTRHQNLITLQQSGN
jgi:hypothetical protein